MTAESAQPRKASNVTRPFPHRWVRSGDDTTCKVHRISFLPFRSQKLPPFLKGLISAPNYQYSSEGNEAYVTAVR